jgi:hypothetical protein
MLFVEQIALHQFLEHLISVQLADHAAGIVVIGDISRILSQKIANNLIDGIIALLAQGFKDGTQGALHVLFFVTGKGEFDGALLHGMTSFSDYNT